jgi:uncharacterized protein
MNIRRLVLDVDKAIAQPAIIDLTERIEAVPGVEAVNVTVTEIDIETVGMNVTVEGERIDHIKLLGAIEDAGAVVNSIDQVVSGDRLIEGVPRAR